MDPDSSLLFYRYCSSFRRYPLVVPPATPCWWPIWDFIKMLVENPDTWFHTPSPLVGGDSETRGRNNLWISLSPGVFSPDTCLRGLVKLVNSCGDNKEGEEQPEADLHFSSATDSVSQSIVHCGGEVIVWEFVRIRGNRNACMNVTNDLGKISGFSKIHVSNHHSRIERWKFKRKL